MISDIANIEIDVFGMLVVFVIMSRTRGGLLTRSQRLFRALEMSAVAILAADMLGWAFDGNDLPFGNVLENAICYLYWALDIVPCYLGLLYCTSIVSDRAYERIRVPFLIPVLIGFAILATNAWTGWIFTVDASNVYHRGPYFPLVGFIPFLHMAASVVISTSEYRRAPRFSRRRYRMLAFFMMIPLAGSILQVLFYGLSTIWTSLIISILACYVYLQKDDLSTDPLTKLNNRRRFDDYSAERWAELGEGSTMQLVMMDLDHFKRVNDTLGHSTGDQALVRCAHALQRAMSSRSGFLARLGGDEFAILLEDASEREVRDIVSSIRHEIAQENMLLAAEDPTGETYRLEMSIGFARSGKVEGASFTKLFDEADLEMYENKRMAHVRESRE
ncbi:MAG: diguanylate cyclase [Atopobiaceae bacterium]|nr:diguanylate cyclase [Atopobiaceae bacterium]MCI2173052.1 diguanylate cyclase [Atopobiaceae bacterium]MCI2208145.1 diguanylate cyclase [Atopobiaceae bacterium]